MKCKDSPQVATSSIIALRPKQPNTSRCLSAEIEDILVVQGPEPVSVGLGTRQPAMTTWWHAASYTAMEGQYSYYVSCFACASVILASSALGVAL